MADSTSKTSSSLSTMACWHNHSQVKACGPLTLHRQCVLLCMLFGKHSDGDESSMVKWKSRGENQDRDEIYSRLIRINQTRSDRDFVDFSDSGATKAGGNNGVTIVQLLVRASRNHVFLCDEAGVEVPTDKMKLDTKIINADPTDKAAPLPVWDARYAVDREADDTVELCDLPLRRLLRHGHTRRLFTNGDTSGQGTRSWTSIIETRRLRSPVQHMLIAKAESPKLGHGAESDLVHMRAFFSCLKHSVTEHTFAEWTTELASDLGCYVDETRMDKSNKAGLVRLIKIIGNVVMSPSCMVRMCPLSVSCVLVCVTAGCLLAAD